MHKKFKTAKQLPMRMQGLCMMMLIIMALCFIGCSDDKEERGIYKTGEYIGYKIYLNEGNVEDYFTLEGTSGKVNISLNGENGRMDGRVIDYSKIGEGGWIAYAGPYVIYLPEEVSKESVQIACSFFSTISSEDCFTIEEVQEYLPWIE